MNRLRGALLMLLVLPSLATAATLRGRVVDRVTRLPVAQARIALEGRTTVDLSDESGRFEILGVREPSKLWVSRSGYQPYEQALGPQGGEPVELVIELEPSPVQVPGIHVGSTTGGHRAGRDVELRGAALQEHLGRTLAETLSGAPGLAQRSLGPSSARPVSRGLGAERLRVLEDGGTTGDLSHTADDHAVTIEPAFSRVVEVVRGPETLSHGSNVLAGLINVRRNHVPAQHTDGVRTTVNLQSETVTRGGVGALTLQAPWAGLQWQIQAMGRRAGELDTPAGRLANASASASDLSGGVARIGDRGLAGASFARYRTRYGIPGGFAGGHSAGVDIDLERERGEFRMERRLGASSTARNETALLWTRYYHRELESRDQPAVSFGVITYEARTGWRWGEGLRAGAAGVTGEYRDVQSGFLSFTPPTIERAFAAYAHQGWQRDGWSGSVGLRGDARAVDPSRRTFNKAGRIERRTFTGVSGGARLSRVLAPAWTVEASLMRSFMPPTVDHLFAEGPHLASFAYEIGNAALAAEAGWGGTLAVRWASAESHVTLTGFDNRFEHFHRSVDTGELEVGPGETGILARYRYVGDAARLWGGEAEVLLAIAPSWWLEAGAAYVNGTERSGRSALPAMPPMRGRVALRWTQGNWSTRIGTEVWRAQHRVAEFEDPTPGSATVSASLSWSRARREDAWSLVLQGHNLLDAEVRDHLSRIRSISPEPGRDLRLGIRVVR